MNFFRLGPLAFAIRTQISLLRRGSLLASAFFAMPLAGAEADLAATLDLIRAKYLIPGMAAAVVRDGRIVASGATGVRLAGFPIPVTVADKFHLGSVTKSMTATVAATLVVEGRISFESTLAQVFPEEVPTMHPALKAITLRQLLSHRGGFIGEKLATDPLWAALLARTGTTAEIRAWFVSELLKKAPENAPDIPNYSNAGYTVAGRMLERVTGQTWENLILSRVFLPLKLDSAGFGTPATPGLVDQPWGHHLDGTAVPPGPGSDVPAAIGPAGTVHMNVRDLARYAAAHLRGHLEEDALLPRDIYRVLHAPADGQYPINQGDLSYGLGWGVSKNTWASPDYLYGHDGTNSSFSASAGIVPARNLAVVVVANSANIAAVHEVEALLITYYLDGPSVVPTPLASGSGRMINLATRAAVGAGDNVSITGFTLTGTLPKTMLIRAAGPTLATFGITDAVADPQLEVFSADGLRVAANDNWSANSGTTTAELVAAAQNVGAFAFEVGTKDAAVLLTLPPGGYTAVARGASATSGTSLVEVYDAARTTATNLVNLSARVTVRGGGDTVIPGFFINGSESAGVLVRVIGPTLSAFGVNDVLYDPVLTLVDHSGRTLAANDDWHESPDRELIRTASRLTSAFSLVAGSRDSAVVLALPPGDYTALVRDRLGQSGVVLLEVYALPPGILTATPAN